MFMQRNRTIGRMDLRMCTVVFLSILYFNLPPATIGESNYMVRTCDLQYRKLARYFHLNGDKCFMVFTDARLLRFTVSWLPLTIRTFFFCFFINIIINYFLYVVITIVSFFYVFQTQFMFSQANFCLCCILVKVTTNKMFLQFFNSYSIIWRIVKII